MTPLGSIAEIADSTAFKLHQATVLIDRVADRYLQQTHGIRYSGFLVLLMVGTLDQPTQREIADGLNVSRASITQRVGQLVADDLVATRPDSDDARAKTVRLTRKGAELLRRAWDGLETHQDGLDAGVDEAALARQLDLLIRNARQILAPAPNGVESQ
jgi:DNA-binding MarR family transcriptional regulator